MKKKILGFLVILWACLVIALFFSRLAFCVRQGQWSGGDRIEGNALPTCVLSEQGGKGLW